MKRVLCEWKVRKEGNFVYKWLFLGQIEVNIPLMFRVEFSIKFFPLKECFFTASYPNVGLLKQTPFVA